MKYLGGNALPYQRGKSSWIFNSTDGKVIAVNLSKPNMISAQYLKCETDNSFIKWHLTSIAIFFFFIVLGTSELINTQVQLKWSSQSLLHFLTHTIFCIYRYPYLRSQWKSKQWSSARKNKPAGRDRLKSNDCKGGLFGSLRPAVLAMCLHVLIRPEARVFLLLTFLFKEIYQLWLQSEKTKHLQCILSAAFHPSTLQ